jgi:hypothetical protein
MQRRCAARVRGDHHRRHHGQRARLACEQAQHRHVVHLGQHVRHDAGGLQQAVEGGAHRALGPGQQQRGALQVIGEDEAP